MRSRSLRGSSRGLRGRLCSGVEEGTLVLTIAKCIKLGVKDVTGSLCFLPRLGFLITGFIQARDQSLQYVDFEEANEIVQTAAGYEAVDQRLLR